MNPTQDRTARDRNAAARAAGSPAPPVAARAGAPQRPSFWRRFRRRPVAVVALALILVYTCGALGVAIYEARCRRHGVSPVSERVDMQRRFASPSRTHWFGTDYRGRDVFWRTLFAAKTAMRIGLLAGIISVTVGVLLGALGGYFGGAVDWAVVWISSTFAAMPTLLFILSFALLLGSGTLALTLGIGLTSWVGLCRVIRAEFIRLRDVPYVQAAKALNLGDWRIITRHILPNAGHLVIVFFTLRFGTAIMTEVIVSFLGLGVQLEPSWGVMIADAKERLWQGVWWELAGATGAMFLLVLAVNLLGDALRDLLDPRLRGAL